MAMRIPGAYRPARSATCPLADRPGSASIEQRSCRKDDRCTDRPGQAARFECKPPGPLEPESTEPGGARRRTSRPHVERATDADHDPSRRDGIRVPIDPPLLLRGPESDEDDRRVHRVDRAREICIAVCRPSDPIFGDGDSGANDLDAHAGKRSAPPIAPVRRPLSNLRRRRPLPRGRRQSGEASRRSRLRAIAVRAGRWRNDSTMATPVPSGRARSAVFITSA